MNTSLKLIPVFFLIFTLNIFKPYQSAAQNVFYSKEERFDFQNGDFSVVGNTGNFLFTYVASQKGYFLNAYNDSMALKARIALDFFPARIEGATFINYPDNIIVLYQAEERNYIIQYAALLDNKALLVNKPIAIDSVKSSFFGGDKQFFKSVVSPDKSKILIYGIGRRGISTALLDDRLNIIHRENHDTKINGKAAINQAFLDNEGRFYFSVTEETGSKNYTNTFELYQLSANGKQLTGKHLPQGQFYYSGMHSKINNDNGIIYTAGFYSDKKKGNLEGVTYFQYNPETKTFSQIKNILFSSELRNDAEMRNKKKAFNDEHVRQLIIKNNGGFLIVAENEYTSTQSEMAPGWGYYSWYYSPVYPDRTIVEYNYGDILLLNFDSTSHLLWHQFIRKGQYSQDDEGLFSSYAFLNSGNTLVFLFNDFNSKSNTMELAAVDGNGKLQMQPMNIGNIGNADWLPRRAAQVSKTTWVVPVLNRNNLFFAKVAF